MSEQDSGTYPGEQADRSGPDGDPGGDQAGQAGPAVTEAPPQPRPFFSDFVDLVYGIFFSPIRTLRDLAARPKAPYGVTVFSYLLVVFIHGLASAATARTAWQAFLDSFIGAMQSGGIPGMPSTIPSAGPGAGFILITIFMALLFAPIGLFFKSGALGLMNSFLGGKGQPSRLFSAFALTYVPSLAVVPFSLLLAGRPGLGTLATLVSILVLVWRLVLDIFAIREVGGVDTGRAVAAALIPLGVLVVLGILAVMLWAFAFAALFGPFLQTGLPGVG